MKIYKLKFNNKEEALTSLIEKGVLTEDQSFGEGILAVVEVGKIAETQGEYDHEGTQIVAPVYIDGYHYDVMSEIELDFENSVIPKNPRHTFLGESNFFN